MQFKGKLLNHTSENSEKPNFAPKFGPPILFRGFYFHLILDIVASYHCMQFQGKRMIQTEENGEETHFGPDFRPIGPNSGRQVFFKNLALSVTRYYGQLPSRKISKRTNDPILRKLRDAGKDRQRERQTDRQTDESNFLGRCPTDVECPCINVSFHMESNKNNITKTKALFKSCYQKLLF